MTSKLISAKETKKTPLKIIPKSSRSAIASLQYTIKLSLYKPTDKENFISIQYLTNSII